MSMDAGLDTGPVYLTEETAIGDDDNAQTLHDRLAEIGARLIVSALDRLELGNWRAVPQPESGVIYAAKIAKSEAHIDWTRNASDIWRQIRAFNPSPGAFTRLRDTELKIWEARLAPLLCGASGQILRADSTGLLVACGTGGALWLDQVQKPGGKRLPTREFLRGFSVAPGEFLT